MSKNENSTCACKSCNHEACRCNPEAKAGCACAPVCGCEKPCRCDGCAC